MDLVCRAKMALSEAAVGKKAVKEGRKVAKEASVEGGTHLALEEASHLLLHSAAAATSGATEAVFTAAEHALTSAGSAAGAASVAGKLLAALAAKLAARETGFGKMGQARSAVGGGAAGAVGAGAVAGLAVAGPAGAAGGAAMGGLGTLAGAAVERGIHEVRLRAGWTKEPEVMNTSIEVGETMMSAGEGGLRGLGISWLELRKSSCGVYAYALTVKTAKKVHIEFQDADGGHHSLTCELPRTHSKRYNAEHPTITKLTITPLE